MANIYKALMEMLQNSVPAVIETSLENLSVDSYYEKELYALKDMEDISPEKGLPSWNSGRLLEYFYPEERLIILGGGHVALALSDFGARAGFSVSVADDRPAFANNVRFASSAEVLCDSFENAIEKLHITASDYVVVLTRGHRYDKECLKQILDGVLPAYLGMMGSKRRSVGMRELLIEEGFKGETVDKIHMPIGMDIGALLPEEIAVSILAQIIAGKRLKKSGASQADVDFRVLGKLAAEKAPHAVVTVLSAKGPTPRRPGAKMIVWPEGRIEGSIGGGCAEAAVMREALKYIGTGKCCVRTVDMTKDVSEDDVMVCGGVMEVLIEG